MPSLRQNHPVMRAVFLVLGVLLLLVAAIVGPFPGPGGIVFAVAGLACTLPNSRWAMRRFAGLKRRWPRAGRLVDRLMRRPSAYRRAKRAQGAARD